PASRTSTSPTRSRAPRASWPSARPCRRVDCARRRNRAEPMSSASPPRPASSPWLAIVGVVALVAAVVVAALLWLLFSGGGHLAAVGHWLYASDVGTAVRYVLESLLLLVCLLLSTAVLIYLERKI